MHVGLLLEGLRMQVRVCLSVCLVGAHVWAPPATLVAAHVIVCGCAVLWLCCAALLQT